MSIASAHDRRLKATLMLMLLTLLWGATFPATRHALSVTDPMHFLALRFGIAVIVLTPFLKKLRRLQSHNSHLTNPSANLLESRSLPSVNIWKGGVLVGVFLFLGCTLQTIGMRYTTASRSGFLTSLLVVIAPILAFVFRTSRSSLTVAAGIPVSIIGVYLMADPEAGGLNIGDILTIFCAVAFAFQMITLEAAADRIRDPWGLTYVQLLIVGVGALLWSLVDGKPFDITWSGSIALVYNALLGTVAAVWLQTNYQPETSAGHASLIYMLEPVFASLFAWILLGETWTGRGLAGGALILAAMSWASFAVMKKI